MIGEALGEIAQRYLEARSLRILPDDVHELICKEFPADLRTLLHNEWRTDDQPLREAMIEGPKALGLFPAVISITIHDPETGRQALPVPQVRYIFAENMESVYLGLFMWGGAPDARGEDLRMRLGQLRVQMDRLAMIPQGFDCSEAAIAAMAQALFIHPRESGYAERAICVQRYETAHLPEENDLQRDLVDVSHLIHSTPVALWLRSWTERTT